ncbi:hypothetical protein B2J93_3748 [Marssonina coronariae]|uniref:Uncharacterized protein n=1 Tax=Diplocarpon coronariae TaxID=2795749 RepID=A0A218YX04_9HELO|nr:hypothetical protein B2J93_3748 [Marssonina coronariae]
MSTPSRDSGASLPIKRGAHDREPRLMGVDESTRHRGTEHGDGRPPTKATIPRTGRAALSAGGHIDRTALHLAVWSPPVVEPTSNSRIAISERFVLTGGVRGRFPGQRLASLLAPRRESQHAVGLHFSLNVARIQSPPLHGSSSRRSRNDVWSASSQLHARARRCCVDPAPAPPQRLVQRGGIMPRGVCAGPCARACHPSASWLEDGVGETGDGGSPNRLAVLALDVDIGARVRGGGSRRRTPRAFSFDDSAVAKAASSTVVSRGLTAASPLISPPAQRLESSSSRLT